MSTCSLPANNQFRFLVRSRLLKWSGSRCLNNLDRHTHLYGNNVPIVALYQWEISIKFLVVMWSQVWIPGHFLLNRALGHLGLLVFRIQSPAALHETRRDDADKGSADTRIYAPPWIRPCPDLHQSRNPDSNPNPNSRDQVHLFSP